MSAEVCWWLPTAPPADIGVEFVRLFKQGVDAPACTRNPLLVQVPGGPLIVFAGTHQFSCYDGGGANLLTRRSSDGGRSWSPVHTLYNTTSTAHEGRNWGCSSATFDTASDSVLLICGADAGEIPPFTGAQGPTEMWTWQSADRNATRWLPKRNITQQLPYFVSATRALEQPNSGCQAGPGRGVVLSSGRFVQCAECGHRGTACFYSDDPRRHTWQQGGKVPTDPQTGCEVEGAVLGNGSLLLNMRTNGPFPHYPNISRSQLYRLFSRSDDGGRSFTAPWYEYGLPNPLCAASTLALRSSDTRPVVLYTSGPLNQTARADMTISRSLDSGASWQAIGPTLWPGYSGYSSLEHLGGEVLGVAFEGGPGGEGCTAISFARVPV